MRRSLFILAALALTPAVYAQGDATPFTREQVLEIFSQYNPSVLEQASQNDDYNTVLDSFLDAYEASNTPMERAELIAVARNFDNSIRLQVLTDAYLQTSSAVSLMGGDASSADRLFREELTDVFGRVWAVTVQLRQYQLAEAKRALKNVRADKTLSQEARNEQIAALKSEIRALKAELKSLQANRGESVLSAVDAYVLQTQQASDGLLQAARQSAAASETENLQIKSNNKKPVAK
ncbi:MAG: hypothetical protein ACI37O_06870 [Candidatus Avelusimicrobium sp.]|uniref:hypothetical protein n=1 Tax=Candidatus Avelusimicrobium sp. TaxID=3048833 RepID=UPI003F04A0FA